MPRLSCKRSLGGGGTWHGFYLACHLALASADRCVADDRWFFAPYHTLEPWESSRTCTPLWPASWVKASWKSRASQCQVRDKWKVCQEQLDTAPDEVVDGVRDCLDWRCLVGFEVLAKGC